MADIIVLPTQFDDRQIEIMRQTLAKDVPPAEFAVFLEVAKYRGLNPFNKEIHPVMRKGRLTIQVGIDGFRLLAERSGKYRGQKGPYFCGKDGVWREEWIEDGPPMAAKVGVIRSDFGDPIWAIARYKSYVQTASDGRIVETWQKFPDVLLAKCAEALAIRKTFPMMVAGLYINEEMQQADVVPVSRASAPTLKALHIKCRDAGIFEDADDFYVFCGDVLDRAVNRENGRSVTIEERARVDVAIDEAIGKLHPVVVESAVESPVQEGDGYISIDEMSRQMAEPQSA